MTLEPKIGDTGVQQQPGENAPEKKPLGKASAKPEEEKKPSIPPQPQAQVDPYFAWMNQNQVVSPEDIAIFRKGDGLLIVLTDPLGRSALNASLYLKKEIVESIIKAQKKA